MATEPDSEYKTTEARVDQLDSLGRPMAAIERYLKSRDLRVPTKDENFHTRVAEQLKEAQFKKLVRQLKYAGRQTINYFIVTGISDFDLSEIRDNVSGRLPAEGDVEGIPREPFLAEAETIGSRLYLAIGYHANAGSEDPVTGRKEDVLITKRTVVVIKDDIDLIEVRGSNTDMVEGIRDELCKAIGKYRESVKDRPNLGPQFQERFNELVGLYYNLKVRVDDKEDQTLDTISFTSKEDEKGNRRDARNSDRVEKELSEKGSEITMGYVELDEGFRFRINRDKAKLSFMKSEREENLNQVTDVIHNVLREAGEYSQDQITGIEDVPE